MNIKLLPEPILQFGNGEHICPRAGIHQYTVADIDNVRPEKIILGLVGNSDSIGTMISWIKKCRGYIEAKKSNQPNLFTNFPGFNNKIAFKSEIVYDESYIRKINNSNFDQVKKLSNDIDELITNSVDLYLTEIRFLAKNENPDVILCVLDEQFTKIIFGTSTIEVENELFDEDEILGAARLNYGKI